MILDPKKARRHCGERGTVSVEPLVVESSPGVIMSKSSSVFKDPVGMIGVRRMMSNSSRLDFRFSRTSLGTASFPDHEVACDTDELTFPFEIRERAIACALAPRRRNGLR